MIKAYWYQFSTRVYETTQRTITVNVDFVVEGDDNWTEEQFDDKAWDIIDIIAKDKGEFDLDDVSLQYEVTPLTKEDIE